MDAARKMGARTFQMGSFKVEFDPISPIVSGKAPEPYDIPASLAEEEHVQGEFKVREDQLAMMLIEDPAAYERLMLSGDLENESATDE